ncbi:MAG: caspase family protein [Sediminispirochaetaceae bacterium]
MLRITGYGAAILLLLTACTINPTPPDRYALVYGVSDYAPVGPDPEYNDLNYTDDDALDMSQALEDKGYTVYRRITDGTGTYPDATAAQLEDDFLNIVPSMSKDDIFLIYFSGHGGQITGSVDENEDQFADDKAEFLYFSDGTNDSTLTDNELHILLSQSDVIKKVVIIDACNSGGFIGQEYDYDALNPEYSSTDETSSGVISNTLKAFFIPKTGDIPPSSAIVISAAGEQEVSWESGAYEHGVFTYALLNAFTDSDNNRDGYIDTGELYYYACEFIEVFWNSIAPGDEEFQYMPRISGGPVDYILFEAD